MKWLASILSKASMVKVPPGWLPEISCADNSTADRFALKFSADSLVTAAVGPAGSTDSLRGWLVWSRAAAKIKPEVEFFFFFFFFFVYFPARSVVSYGFFEAVATGVGWIGLGLEVFEGSSTD